MNNTRPLRHVLAALLLAAALPAQAAPPLTIYGVEEAPGSYASDKGKPMGIAVDVVQEIQRRVGSSDPVQIVAETTALDTARTKPNVVAFSFSRTAEREAQFHWITQVIRKPWVLYAKKDGGVTAASLDDMRRLAKIGVVDGDVRAKYLQKEGFTNLLVAAEPEDNIRNLLEGKVQAIFYEPAGVAYYCRKLKCTKEDVASVWSPRSSDVYILMSKGTDPATVKAWQDAAAAMKADGSFEQIARRWVVRAAMDFGIDSAVKDGAVNFR